MSLTNGDITYKLEEFVQSDPFGIGGLVNVGERVSAGIVDISATQDIDKDRNIMR